MGGSARSTPAVSAAASRSTRSAARPRETAHLRDECLLRRRGLFFRLRGEAPTSAFRASSRCTPLWDAAVDRSSFRAPQECKDAAEQQEASSNGSAGPSRL